MSRSVLALAWPGVTIGRLRRSIREVLIRADRARGHPWRHARGIRNLSMSASRSCREFALMAVRFRAPPVLGGGVSAGGMSAAAVSLSGHRHPTFRCDPRMCRRRWAGQRRRHPVTGRDRRRQVSAVGWSQPAKTMAPRTTACGLPRRAPFLAGRGGIRLWAGDHALCGNAMQPDGTPDAGSREPDHRHGRALGWGRPMGRPPQGHAKDAVRAGRRNSVGVALIRTPALAPAGAAST